MIRRSFAIAYRARWALSAALAVLLPLLGTTVSAHHSYVLTVYQLRAGLEKAVTPNNKGFVMK